jgi:hypothetical protein
MKIFCGMLLLAALCGGFAFSQVETSMDASFYASTHGEIQFNFRPEWQFPALRGKTPMTENNSITLKLDASLSPITAGLKGSTVINVFPFLSFTFGAMGGTGWNYSLFGKHPLAGLGLNRRTSIEDTNEGVIGKGLDGLVCNVNAGATMQFDFAVIFPGDWNHVLINIYNEVDYFAYTKAKGNDFWYYQTDKGLNQNAFRYEFDAILAYAMPIFIDLAGVQFEGSLPIYNIATGNKVRDIGFEFDIAFLANFAINDHLSIMALARFSNGLTAPVTSAYEREWAFDRAQLIATWNIR